VSRPAGLRAQERRPGRKVHAAHMPDGVEARSDRQELGDTENQAPTSLEDVEGRDDLRPGRRRAQCTRVPFGGHIPALTGRF